MANIFIIFMGTIFIIIGFLICKHHIYILEKHLKYDQIFISHKINIIGMGIIFMVGGAWAIFATVYNYFFPEF
jgi:hypothetical protein